MTFNIKIGAFLVGALLVFGMAGVASAQVTSTTSSCLIFNNNVGYGAYDYSSNGAVTGLQNFLVAQGYFNSVYLGTGHFGAITMQAVAQFQAAHGVPATGFVGPLTRALIQQLTCGTNPTPTPTTSVSLYSAYPTSGAVGSTVTLTGAGFSSSNTILMDGNVAASNVSPSSFAIPVACNPYAGSCAGGAQQSLTFTIPSALAPYCAAGYACPQYMRLLTAGQYSITVLNANGTSNAITFTITSGTSVQPLY